MDKQGQEKIDTGANANAARICESARTLDAACAHGCKSGQWTECDVAYSAVRKAFAQTLDGARTRYATFAISHEQASTVSEAVWDAHRAIRRARACGWDIRNHAPTKTPRETPRAEARRRWIDDVAFVDSALAESESRAHAIAGLYEREAEAVTGISGWHASVHPWKADPLGGDTHACAVWLCAGARTLDARDAIAVNHAVSQTDGGAEALDGVRAAARRESRRRFSVRLEAGGCFTRNVEVCAREAGEAERTASAMGPRGVSAKATMIGLDWDGAPPDTTPTQEPATPFLDECATGTRTADEIETAIDRWKANTAGRRIEEEIGANEAQIAGWRTDAESAKPLIEARRQTLGLTLYTVAVSFPAYQSKTVQVAGRTVEDAMQLAIEVADADDQWEDTGDPGPTSVDAAVRGHGDPWGNAHAIKIPGKFIDRHK